VNADKNERLCASVHVLVVPRRSLRLRCARVVEKVLTENYLNLWEAKLYLLDALRVKT
jgi:hypothetical protein